MRKALTIISVLVFVICFSTAVQAEGTDSLIARKDQPWFGFNLENSVEKKVEEIPNGALIKDVIVGSNAEEMGLMKNDIVKKVDDVEVTSVKTFMDEVFKKKPGEEVKLVVFRNGESIEISFRLEDFHKRADGALSALGFSTKVFNIDNIKGVVVASVTEGSYADYGGLLTNDLILAMNHRDFQNLAEFEIILSDVNLERPVDIMVVRSVDNKQIFVPLKVGPKVEVTEEETAAKDVSNKESQPPSVPDKQNNPHK